MPQTPLGRAVPKRIRFILARLVLPIAMFLALFTLERVVAHLQDYDVDAWIRRLGATQMSVLGARLQWQTRWPKTMSTKNDGVNAIAPVVLMKRWKHLGLRQMSCHLIFNGICLPPSPRHVAWFELKMLSQMCINLSGLWQMCMLNPNLSATAVKCVSNEWVGGVEPHSFGDCELYLAEWLVGESTWHMRIFWDVPRDQRRCWEIEI